MRDPAQVGSTDGAGNRRWQPFGSVVVDSPVASDEPATKRMVDFQEGVSPAYAWAFAVSFVFRPYFKIFALGACGIIGLVLLLYGLKALRAAAKVLAEEE